MKKFSYKRAVFGLVLFGLVVRVLYLGRIPAGFFRDEAAIGYNAFSIWMSGKDEFGMYLPIVFRSFEVFFLPLYIYLTAPVVGILGLSEFSTRLISSFSGILALIFIYFIAKESWNRKVGIFALLVLVIAPWHIFYSRGAFEGNLALTLFTAGFLFLLRFINKGGVRELFASALFFALSMYSYQSQRLVVPLLGVFVALIAYKKIWTVRYKMVLIAGVVFLILFPLLLLSFKAGGYHRAFGVSIFAKEEKPSGWVKGKEPGLFINNELYLRTRQITALYLSYFSPRNLFIEGDFDRQRSVENYSVFYAWMAPFLIYGIVISFKRRKKTDLMLLAWMFLGPLPAAITGDPFHTYRSLLFYMPLTIFVGAGIEKAYEKVRKYRQTGILLRLKFRKLYVVTILALSFFSLFQFLYNYAILTQATRARAWDYGYREIVEFIDTFPNVERVVVDDSWTEAYIHFLFFGKVNPTIYHSEVARLGDPQRYYYVDVGVIRPNKFINYEFRKVNWPTERGDKGTIFVMTSEALPESEFITDPKVELLNEIFYPDGKVAYRIVKII